LDVSAKSVSVFGFKILLLEGRPPSDAPRRGTRLRFMRSLFSLYVLKCMLLIISISYIYTVGDGKCVICDSFVNPAVLVRVCDECNYGSFEGRCCVCGGVGVTDAYYCRECVQQEKDRDGCPKIVNLGATKTDLFYERKKYGFKRR
jgi:PHD finger-like domain-containing protein 5A